MSDRSRPRVVFFALRELDLPVLLPVLREVARCDRFEIGVISPPYVASGGGRVQEGLSSHTLEALQRDGIVWWGHHNGQPAACVVVADACYERIDGWGPVVCVGHGTISKGLYFTERSLARRENFARVLCVPGPRYVASFGRQLFTRVVATSFSKMDDLAAPREATRRAVLARLQLDPDKRTLLFAPTYNPELTSLHILSPAWSALDAERDQVLFKLHGATDEADIAHYRALATQLPHARFVDDSALAPYLLASDVVISDVSSAAVEALAVGVPVVVANNPAYRTYPHYDAVDVEYQTRDAAYQVHSDIELLDVLRRLRDEDPLATRRREYAAEWFVPVDGQNSARIAAEVAAVVDGVVLAPMSPSAGRLSVYVPADVVDEDQLARIDRNLQRASSALKVVRGGTPPTQPFTCLTGEYELPNEWDLVWSMASHFNTSSRAPLTGIFGPMLSDDNTSGDQRRSACLPDASGSDATLQVACKYHACDQIARADVLEADASIVSGSVPRDLALAWVQQLAHAKGRANVARRVQQRGGHIGVLAGLYALSVAAATVARPDLLFYCFKNVHMALFAPVIAAVRRLRPDATIAFSAPASRPDLRHGLTLDERATFARETGAEWIADAEAARPAVTVIADCVADRLPGHQRIVNIGHGLISKGQYYGNSPLIGRENLAHEMCVPGPWHADQLQAHVYVPVHVTGMSKLDALFAPFDEVSFRAAHGLGRDERVLLWCPTFNPELSSLPVIGADICRLTQFGTVLVKMHGSTDPDTVAALRTAVAHEPRVRVLDVAADATPFMRCASLLITDVSSVMFEFAALDRPLILVDNPLQSSYVNYCADDVEYAMRDVGVRVSSVDHLVEAVREELADPGRLSAARRRVTALMFAGTDGRNAERIAAVLCGPAVAQPWRGGFDAVLPPSFTLEDVAFAAPTLQTAASVIGPAAASAAARGCHYRPYTNNRERDAAIAASQAPNILLMHRRARLAGDWRAPLFGPLYLGADAPRMTSPLTTDRERPATYVGRFIKRDRVMLPAKVTTEFLAGLIRVTNPGERALAEDPSPAVVAMRRDRLPTAKDRAVVVADALGVT